MVKLIFALFLSMVAAAIVCFPIFVVVMGIIAPLFFWSHVAVTAIGLFLCYLVKPVSINDYQLF